MSPVKKRPGIALGAFVVIVAAAIAWERSKGATPSATLVKSYETDCMLSKAGEQYDLAEVESAPLCASLARAFNFARTAQKETEFGVCWDSYSFHCENR